jgi:hypothetical protein
MRGRNLLKPRLFDLAVELSIMKAAVPGWSGSDRENMRLVAARRGPRKKSAAKALLDNASRPEAE